MVQEGTPVIAGLRCAIISVQVTVYVNWNKTQA